MLPFLVYIYYQGLNFLQNETIECKGQLCGYSRFWVTYSCDQQEECTVDVKNLVFLILCAIFLCHLAVIIVCVFSEKLYFKGNMAKIYKDIMKDN